MTLAINVSPPAIRSVFCHFPNRNGKLIAAYIDQPPPDRDHRKFVVMSPKYGESKKNNLQLAYYLSANGFTVLRFDFTCHFGESEGNPLDFTLPDSVDNICSALDYLEETHGVKQAILVASSLSSLPAFRAAADDSRIARLIGVVPVVDFAYSISRVYQEDLIGNFIGGKRYGVLDILGHDVNMDNFCQSIVSANMHNLEGTIAGIKQVKCPVTLLPAAGDVWVSIESVESVAAANPNVSVCLLEGAMHEVRENRAAAAALIQAVVGICWEHVFEKTYDPTGMATPNKKLLFHQNGIERDRLRQARPLNENENDFWSKYLVKYRVMEKMDDYQEYLDRVGAGLGEFQDGEIVLDAGCGNGLFGVWILRELMQRSKRVFKTPPLYVGIDLTDSGLRDAMAKHSEAWKLLGERPKAKRIVEPGLLYSRVDLDDFGKEDEGAVSLLKFRENTFDKIACSLLLSYLKSPQELLNHLYRLLRPGGSIVVSSMKPFCDLSAIYRDFVEQKAARKDVESARELLRAAGAIQIKQDQGYYVFFSDTELVDMLAQAGFRNPHCSCSLGNQANVAVGTK